MERTPAKTPPCLVALPAEIIFIIIRIAIGTGRECDVSALVRTSKGMHQSYNPELYKVVSQYNTFYIVNWAAQENRLKTLQLALGNGASPNELRTRQGHEAAHVGTFRPASWGINTTSELAVAIERQVKHMSDALALSQGLTGRHLHWLSAWFSSPGLSLVNSDELLKIWARDCWYLPASGVGPVSGQSLSSSCDHGLVASRGFTFQEDSDQPELKLAFVNLFRWWHSALHTAAFHDNLVITKTLLEKEADVDATATWACQCHQHTLPSSWGDTRPRSCLVAYTALHVAICLQHYATARVLVAHGAHRLAMLFSGPDNRRWIADNPLHAALSTREVSSVPDYLDFVEFLLRDGHAGWLHETNHEGLTPLAIACNAVNGYEAPRYEIIKLLLRYGADPDRPSPCPGGARHITTWTALGGAPEVATPAVWAARSGQLGISKFLLDHGAKADTASSTAGITMLHAVCSGPLAATPPSPPYSMVTPSRIALLDAILARCTADHVNSLDADGWPALRRLILWCLRLASPDGEVMQMISNMFKHGADILACGGGAPSPLDEMISTGLRTAGLFRPLDVANTTLAILQASGISQHPSRPKAFLNGFWPLVENALGIATINPELVRKNAACILHALLKAGFSPAEVDTHGDTAMISFLQCIHRSKSGLMRTWEAASIRHDFYSRGSLIQSVMALLQEHGAALSTRNQQGHTAFDCLRRMAEYDGKEKRPEYLTHYMSHIVRPGKDESGSLCLKFHPNKSMYGSLSHHQGLDETIAKVNGNPARWLVCEHWCRRYCEGTPGSGEQSCQCARGPHETGAGCKGQCCSVGDGFLLTDDWDL